MTKTYLTVECICKRPIALAEKREDFYNHLPEGSFRVKHDEQELGAKCNATVFLDYSQINLTELDPIPHFRSHPLFRETRR